MIEIGPNLMATIVVVAMLFIVYSRRCRCERPDRRTIKTGGYEYRERGEDRG